MIFSRAIRAVPLAALLVPGTALAQPQSQPQSQPQYPPASYPPSPSYQYVAESDLHIVVKPREASVYVDGYFAGIVDDFDGTFQRLHTTSGQHEITVYMKGYRSLTRRLYLEPGRARLIEGQLEALAPGEAQEPEPMPLMPPPRPDQYGDGGPGPYQGRRPMGEPPQNPREPGGRPYPEDRPPDSRERGAQAQPIEPSRFGTVAVRVQPAGATVLIDGEKWEGPADNDERLIVQVPPGHHTIEVTKDGYRRYVTEIDVDADRTANVNINLSRDR